MNLIILGSNSLGNCYVLDTPTEALIIEAGVNMSKVKKSLRWQINKVVGAIVTHRHNDHAGYVTEMVASGVTVLALRDVFDAHGLTGKPFTKEITEGHGYKLGNFKIQALQVKHDVPCLAYIIYHPDMGRLLFVTDTVSFNYIVPHLNAIMIEANYADDIVLGKIAAGEMPEAMRPRLLNSHMEIGQTKEILKSNDLSDTENIILIHLSDGNADEERFVREIRETTGKTVYAAKADTEIDISLKPY